MQGCQQASRTVGWPFAGYNEWEMLGGTKRLIAKRGNGGRKWYSRKRMSAAERVDVVQMRKPL